MWNGADRLVRITASQASGSALKMKPSRMIAALLTTMSSPPKRSTASATAAAAAEGLAMLSVKAAARSPKPCASDCATPGSPPLPSIAVPRSAMTTAAPCACSNSTMARARRRRHRGVAEIVGPRGERAEMRLVIDVALVARAEIKMDRLAHAKRQRRLDDGFDRRQAGAAGDGDDRPRMLLAQPGRAVTAFDDHVLARRQPLRDIGAGAARPHSADMEFEQRLVRPGCPRIIPRRPIGET